MTSRTVLWIRRFQSLHSIIYDAYFDRARDLGTSSSVARAQYVYAATTEAGMVKTAIYNVCVSVTNHGVRKGSEQKFGGLYPTEPIS